MSLLFAVSVSKWPRLNLACLSELMWSIRAQQHARLGFKSVGILAQLRQLAAQHFNVFFLPCLIGWHVLAAIQWHRCSLLVTWPRVGSLSSLLSNPLYVLSVLCCKFISISSLGVWIFLCFYVKFLRLKSVQFLTIQPFCRFEDHRSQTDLFFNFNFNSFPLVC